MSRLNEQKGDRDAAVSNATIGAQLAAIHAWGQGDPSKLSESHHPVLVANGDADVMAPTINSFELRIREAGSQLSSLTALTEAAWYSTASVDSCVV